MLSDSKITFEVLEDVTYRFLVIRVENGDLISIRERFSDFEVFEHTLDYRGHEIKLRKVTYEQSSFV